MTEKERRLDLFIADIESVCRDHDCVLASHGYDTIEVREFKQGDAAISCTMIENLLED